MNKEYREWLANQKWATNRWWVTTDSDRKQAFEDYLNITEDERKLAADILLDHYHDFCDDDDLLFLVRVGVAALIGGIEQ